MTPMFYTSIIKCNLIQQPFNKPSLSDCQRYVDSIWWPFLRLLFVLVFDWIALFKCCPPTFSYNWHFTWRGHVLVVFAKASSRCLGWSPTQIHLIKSVDMQHTLWWEFACSPCPCCFVQIPTCLVTLFLIYEWVYYSPHFISEVVCCISFDRCLFRINTDKGSKVEKSASRKQLAVSQIGRASCRERV